MIPFPVRGVLLCTLVNGCYTIRFERVLLLHPMGSNTVTFLWNKGHTAIPPRARLLLLSMDYYYALQKNITIPFECVMRGRVLSLQEGIITIPFERVLLCPWIGNATIP